MEILNVLAKYPNLSAVIRRDKFGIGTVVVVTRHGAPDDEFSEIDFDDYYIRITSWKGSVPVYDKMLTSMAEVEQELSILDY